MAKYRVVCVKNEDKFTELARLVHNLRYFSNIWKEHYGAMNRVKMEYWQKAVDEWLKENVDYTDITDLVPPTPAKYDTWAENTKIYG